MAEASPSSPPHVLIFPFPAQGHVNSMLKLAELLCLSGLSITFVNTEHNHQRLLRFSDIQSRFSKHPGFKFQALPDGLPADHPRTNGRILDLFDSMEVNVKPLLKEMLLMLKGYQPVDCVIGDGVLGFVLDVAVEVCVPIVYFRTISACCFWVYFCVPDAIDAGELPIKEDKEDMDRLITKVPGMETFLRCRDLPSFCRVQDMEDPSLRLVLNETRQTPRAGALILNTFEDLEGPILSHIRKHCPKTYTIGPLHLQLQTRLTPQNTQQQHISSNSLWEENRSCLTWLDDQPTNSVLYVCFGSVTVMTTEQVLEFWNGLINSKKKFLWVIRPNSVTKENDKDLENVPAEIVNGVSERDHMVIVGWVPQEEVLAHRSVGAFWTHSGWNSTLESIVSGKPMICWPYFADQQVNSRFVSEVWKVGLDLKDVWERRVVEKMVNDLMVERRDELVRSAVKMAELAKKSVSEGGSSCSDLDRLVKDLRLMSMMRSALHDYSH